MSTVYWLILALAAAPQPEHRPLVAPPPVFLPHDVQSPAALREAHRAAMWQSYRAEPADVVPELVKVHRLIDRDGGNLSSTERAELLLRLRTRLLAMGDKVVSDARRERNKARREKATAAAPATAVSSPATVTATASRAGQPASYGPTPQPAAGGLGQDDGEALVDLIRSVIRPDSWDVNGGPGRIVYYRPVQALVVYQTEEVHWLIGGLRGALGK